MNLAERRSAWRALTKTERDPELRVEILSTFTAEPIIPYLGMAFEGAGLGADIHVGPYNQIAQECLDPASSTASGRPDVVVVWPRLEDLWAAEPLPLSGSVGRYVGHLEDLASVAIEALQWTSTLVFVLPAIPEVRPLGVGDACNPSGVFAAASAAREEARQRLCRHSGVLVADAEEVVRQLGSDNSIDWRRATLARMPYTEAAYAMVGERIARLVHLARRGAKKVVAVDADNTLWGGVVGEDGPSGIDLFDNGPGEAYLGFQAYLRELRRAGAALALVSKNNDGDLWEAFDRPEMRLRRSDFAAWRVNWEPKSESLRQIAAELNLGVDSIAFIDDSPVERAEVTNSLPVVEALEMPADASMWYLHVGASGVLDRLPPTADDLNRALSYSQESERRIVREQTSLEGFLESLELKLEIQSPGRDELTRPAQLLAKTNQFTLGGRRRSETELLACLEDPRYDLRVVKVSDRFGDYGTVGVLIVDHEPDMASAIPGVALLDTFALSCRAMGRGVESAMVAVAGEIAGGHLSALVQETAKNAPAVKFFSSLGCQAEEVSLMEEIRWPDHIVPVGEHRTLSDTRR